MTHVGGSSENTVFDEALFEPFCCLQTVKYLLVLILGQVTSRIGITHKVIYKAFLGDTLSGRAKLSSPSVNPPLSPDEKFLPIKVKVSLNDVQVYLRGKQVM